MPQKLPFWGFLSISSLFLLVACSEKEPTASKTPAIEFLSIKKYTLEATGSSVRRDSVIVDLNFTDGDGDLGEDPRDTTRLKQIFANQPWGNYQIRTMQLVNGNFIEVPIAANAKLFFPRITSKPAYLNGTLSFKQTFIYQATAKLVPIKFQIKIRDRQLNESNTIETDTVRVPIQ